MAVEKSAVREGTRWWFDGEEVLVQEVTPKSIVFYGDDCGLGLIAIGDFLIRAEDPAISRHELMVKRFSRLVGRDPSDEIGGAILYLLKRLGSPAPVAFDIAEPVPSDVCGCGSCTVEVPHASDCAVHNEPAYPAGPCDCGTEPNPDTITVSVRRYESLKAMIADHDPMKPFGPGLCLDLGKAIRAL